MELRRWFACCLPVILVGCLALAVSADRGTIGLPAVICMGLLPAADGGDIEACMAEAAAMSQEEQSEMADIVLGGDG